MKKSVLFISLIGNILLIVLLIRSAIFFNENLQNPSYQSEFIGRDDNQEYTLGNSANQPRNIKNVTEERRREEEEAKLRGEDNLDEVVVREREVNTRIKPAREIGVGDEEAIQASNFAKPNNSEDEKELDAFELARLARIEENAQKIEEINSNLKSVDEMIITKITTTYRDNLLSILIDANQPIDARVYELDEPVRLVMDINGRWELPGMPTLPNNEFVKTMRTGYQTGITRIVVDIEKNNYTYDLQKRDNSLQLYIFFNTK